MHFVLQTPSLKHLVQVQIVADVWNQRDILTQIVRLYEYEPLWVLPAELKEIDEKVKSKVSALPLPDRCKKELLNFVKPLGLEIIDWLHYHSKNELSFTFLGTLLLHQFSWTMHGTIDYQKTAELMVKDERIDADKRYKLACINCLEDKARELIKFLPEHRRMEYVNGMRNVRKGEPYDLIIFFTCTLSGDASRLNRYFDQRRLRGDSIYKYLFRVELRRRIGWRNLAVCEYLFEKLNRREKDQLLENYLDRLRSFGYTEIFDLMFHLPRMSEEQREHLFRERTHFLLRCFLEWPYQPLFMETARRGWSLLNKDSCKKILCAITCSILYGYDNSQLFWECWELTPTEYKQHFLRDVRCLCDLTRTKKEEFISLVFMETTSHQLLLFDPINGVTEVFYDEIMRLLKIESVISDAALIGFKEKAVMESSNDKEDVVKRLRSQGVGQLVDRVMESRIKRREMF